ncbi:MAG: HAMP domain-containing sensor histidine kinase [Byssovorax sp.]
MEISSRWPEGSREPTGPGREKARFPPLILFMLLAVASVAALAFWDEERESGAALDDFAEEQAMLAGSVASELSTRLAAIRRDALLIAESVEEGRRPPATFLDSYTSYALRPAAEPAPPAGDEGLALRVPAPNGRALDLVVAPVRLLEGAARIERPGAVRLFITGPPGAGLFGTDGRTQRVAPIEQALSAGQASAWLSRVEAAPLGLPQRRAVAGLSQVDGGPLGRWGIAVVSSAERVRDREVRARIRLALGVILAAGLVFAFGSVALRKQRRELLLERELAVTDLARDRDRRLATSSKAAMMGTLAMGIAHEVSTPLGIIHGRAEQLVPRVAADDRSARAIDAILEQVDRIRRVIRGFLDVARGEAPVFADLDPSTVLHGAVALVEHRFTAAGVTLRIEADRDLPAIHCDVLMLQQALANLLLNACDACKRGGHVEAAIHRDGERLTFIVTDDGAGITPEHAAKATEPFFTTKPAGQGTGLGLAIANEIARMHRGSLSIQPASPRGTTASVMLPTIEVRSRSAA